MSQTQDSRLKEISKLRSTTFIKKLIDEVETEISAYLNEFPDDDSIEKFWEIVKNKLVSVPQTKKRLQELRKIWRVYQKDGNWKKRIRDLNNFLMEKGVFKKEIVEPFDKSKVKLVTIDFIS